MSEHYSCDLCTTIHDPLLQFSQFSGSTAELFVLQIIPEELHGFINLDCVVAMRIHTGIAVGNDRTLCNAVT